jgi:hypothetical protein
MPEWLTRHLSSADGKQLSLGAYVLLLLLSLAFFVPGQAALPPVDRDEPMFAQATKQMIETGNYVDIRFQDKQRYQKPIGIYWLQAASVHLLNPDHLNEIWAYRVPSLLGAIITILMTAAVGSLLFNPATGFLAAVMMVSCVMLNVEARLAKTDAMLLATIMIAQYGLARAFHNQAKNWKNALLFWGAVGLGILIKGPIIILVVASTCVWIWRVNKNIIWFKKLYPLRGLLLALAIAAPWFIAISLASHGAFMQQSAGHDFLAKIWQGQDRGIIPPGLHLLVFPIMFFPFSLFALLSFSCAWKARREPSVAFCLGWIIPTWIVFELSLTKLPHYVLPTYPAIAMLTAKVLTDNSSAFIQPVRLWLSTTTRVWWGIVGIALAGLVAILPYLLDSSIHEPEIITGSILVIFVCLSGLIIRKSPLATFSLMTIGCLGFYTMVFGYTLPNLHNFWMSRDILSASEAARPCATTHIISAPYSEPSLIFMAGTNTVTTPSGSVAADQLKQDQCAIALLDKDKSTAFLESFKKGARQPFPVGTVHSYNLGNNKWRELILYGFPNNHD